MSIYDPLSMALGIEPIPNPSYLNDLLNEELLSLRNQKIPGPKHSDSVKNQISESNLLYYQTEKGLSRRKELSERNRAIKSEEMKLRWKENYEELREKTKLGGRKKGSLDKTVRQPKCTIQRITDGYRIFDDAYQAAQFYGIHPVNIRRKCRKMIGDWRYV